MRLSTLAIWAAVALGPPPAFDTASVKPFGQKSREVSLGAVPGCRLMAPQVLAQSAADAKPVFEVASIKRCRDDVLPPGGRGGGGSSFSPGRMNLRCQTLTSFIFAAYVVFANGRAANLSPFVPIEGSPAWIGSERYDINAKAEGNPSPEMMYGPMLQALLEDRFKLRIRREIREVPAYALTVAKSGLKLHHFKEGSCTPRPPLDVTKPLVPPPPLAPGERYCVSAGRREGLNLVLEFEGISLDEFCKALLRGSGRPVINKTGITGKFDFHLEYAPDETTPTLPPDDSSVPTAPSIFTAIQQQLGLKLEPTKGPRDFLVIDHIERPSAN